MSCIIISVLGIARKLGMRGKRSGWFPGGSAPGFYLPSAAQHFDLSPDDQRLLAQVRDILVQNFFEELRQVVPGLRSEGTVE